MNLYLRYFDSEILVETADQAVEFLKSIPELAFSKESEHELRDYIASDVYYPKRYKVRPRVYFIVIKTEAKNMEEFKSKKAVRTVDGPKGDALVLARLNEKRVGWYEGRLEFKRVVVSPTTGKCEYRDTVFAAQVKAESGMDCYNIICDHLSQRVDSRSQFPSVKGKNFQFSFLGTCK